MPKRKVLRIEKALCYCRVSTSAQIEGDSLGIQERNLVAAAEAAGFTDIEVLREEGRSGASLKKRPVLKDARQRLKAGQASALFVTNLDRLGRNTLDILQVHDEAEAQGWRVVITSQGGWDTATPVGRVMLTMLAALAEWERARGSVRCREVHADRRKRGIVWGVDMGCRSSVSEVVRQTILEARKRGETYRQIAASLTSRGVETPTGKGGTWYPVTVKRIVDSPQSKAISVAA